jgi:hypothetical protein
MIDIFIKSYRKDFQWLQYSLRSIEKFLTGYNKIIICVPENDYNKFLESFKFPNLNIEVHSVNEYGNGYLYQQYIKMTAHKYSDAEYILYSDSDLIYDRPTNINDLIIDGKSEILYTDYSKAGTAIVWKEPTERFMNEPQQYEFMRRHGLIYHRSSIETLYNLVPNLEDIIMRSEIFSEFNAIGAWCFKNEKNKYRFVNTETWTYVPPIARQFWSHSGLTGNDMLEINTILQ